MRWSLPTGTAVVFLALGALHATAQPGPARPDRRADLSRVCALPLQRFCPALADSPPQRRNQVICLRPYRTSLPLPCRNAVTAALR